MKKSIKIILCLSLVAIMCTGLCSCDALDELRKRQGTYSNDYTQITLDGVVYKACPKELIDAFSTYVNENSDIYYYDYEAEVYIADEDTPVLLNSLFGDFADIYNDNSFIYINTLISSDELESEKCNVFINLGESYTETRLKKEITYYDFGAYYFTEKNYEQMVNYATNYKETNFGTYNEDKSEIYYNGSTYIKAPEDLHKVYDDYNKSIFDVIDYDDEYDCIYISSENEDETSTMFEVYGGKILYSSNWSSSTWRSPSDLQGGILYNYYIEDTEEYYYYAYYFREDVYDELVDELMK